MIIDLFTYIPEDNHIQINIFKCMIFMWEVPLLSLKSHFKMLKQWNVSHDIKYQQKDYCVYSTDTYHIVAETKWPPFWCQHLQTHYLIENSFSEVSPKIPLGFNK